MCQTLKMTHFETVYVEDDAFWSCIFWRWRCFEAGSFEDDACLKLFLFEDGAVWSCFVWNDAIFSKSLVWNGAIILKRLFEDDAIFETFWIDAIDLKLLVWNDDVFVFCWNDAFLIWFFWKRPVVDTLIWKCICFNVCFLKMAHFWNSCFF